MSIVIAHPVFFLLPCRLFVSLADDMKWKYSLPLSLSSTTNSTQSAFWHLKNATGSRKTTAGPPLIGSRAGLPLNFRCLRSRLRRDRWCLCRWMNTLLCALPFGLNISVSNVTNQMFVSRYMQPSRELPGDLLYMIFFFFFPAGCRRAHPRSMDDVYSLRLWCVQGNLLWIYALRHGDNTGVSALFRTWYHSCCTVCWSDNWRLASLYFRGWNERAEMYFSCRSWAER